MDINGANYSFGPNGWDQTYQKATDYEVRQETFRSGPGVVLNLTRDQEKRLAACLAKKRDPYSKLSNNCGTPGRDCLKEVLGHPVSDSILPLNLINDLLDSSLFKGTTEYFGPGPATDWWSNAPWTL